MVEKGEPAKEIEQQPPEKEFRGKYIRKREKSLEMRKEGETPESDSKETQWRKPGAADVPSGPGGEAQRDVVRIWTLGKPQKALLEAWRCCGLPI